MRLKKTVCSPKTQKELKGDSSTECIRESAGTKTQKELKDHTGQTSIIRYRATKTQKELKVQGKTCKELQEDIQGLKLKKN